MYGDNVAIKKTDITTLKGESAIPISIKGFFDVENQSFREEKQISVLFESEEMLATISTVKTTGQTKITWGIDFRQKIRDCCSHYTEGDYPYLVFKKNGANRYNIELESNLEEYLAKNGISEEYVDSIDVHNPRKTITPEQLEFKNRLISYIKENFQNGIKFSSSTIMILSNMIGEEIPVIVEQEIKSDMFKRKDDVYFFFEDIATDEILAVIKKDIDQCIGAIGCVEVTYLFEQYRAVLNETIINDVNDFEDYIKQKDIKLSFVYIYTSRFGKIPGSYNNDVLSRIVKKIEEVILDEHSGFASIDEITQSIRGITNSTLEKILSGNSKSLVRTIVNNTICFQYDEDNVVPQHFTQILDETLEKLDDVEIDPSEEILIATLSLRMGVNFFREYCSQDSKIFRKIVEKNYSGTTKREWKRGAFVKEV
ncbi:hypothetical protein [Candidatus Methanarcanum hacksteinii]|uniref:hypothetical protein n=1 Tax=Candidatus Methanarcanum hacksteinii TaxID=2911857 RepID=UPI0037DD0F91